MNIAIDIDDTLTQSFDYFLPFVAEYFGADEGELRARNISYSTLPEAWKKREVPFARAYFDRFAADTPFKPDAAWGVGLLRAAGHRIVIITRRSDALYTDPYQTTREELAKGGIPYDKLICTMDKAAACREEQINLLIDDMAEHCDAAVRQGIPAVLFSSKGNQGICREYPRVENWREAVEAARQIDRGYPDKARARQLLLEAEEINPGPWADHGRVAAQCAQRIAQACGMDGEKAYVLGLLHDIGRRFLVRDLGHIYNGYQYMTRLGFGAAARICLSHSFATQNLDDYIGQFDIPLDETARVRLLLDDMVFDDMDRLIQLCDALAGSGGVVDMEERMADVKRRYGRYSQEKWDKNLALKRYFERKAGRSMEEILGGPIRPGEEA